MEQVKKLSSKDGRLEPLGQDGKHVEQKFSIVNECIAEDK